MLAAAHARLGHVDEAKRWLAQSVRLRPYITVRSLYPEELGSPVYAQQLRNYQAGLRDHADEDTEFDVPPDALLRSEMAGQTPSEAPGVKTIRTAELVGFLAEAQPSVSYRKQAYAKPGISSVSELFSIFWRPVNIKRTVLRQRQQHRLAEYANHEAA